MNIKYAILEKRLSTKSTFIPKVTAHPLKTPFLNCVVLFCLVFGVAAALYYIKRRRF